MARNENPEKEKAPVNGQAEAAPEETRTASPAVKRGPTVAKRSARKEARKAEDPEEKIETAISTTERYIIENGRTLLTVLAALVLLSGIVIAYKYMYIPNRAEKAGAAMYVAEQHFAEDSYDYALNGDGFNAGFLEVIDKYGSTPQGNIANHYAGISYLKLGDLDRAAEYLSKYKATKGVPNEMINAQNYGLQGDIHVQKGEYEKAADLYSKAVAAGNNSLTAPYYLKKLATVYDKLGRSGDALKALERILDEYPMSIEGRDVEKFIGAEEQKQ
ncbi:MAG: tetratricopeptide repeat protein [Rikenellaceae bacterium]|nr:tetratricopeptide repeat protein [Rikenellaceae bacterium]